MSSSSLLPSYLLQTPRVQDVGRMARHGRHIGVPAFGIHLTLELAEVRRSLAEIGGSSRRVQRAATADGRGVGHKVRGPHVSRVSGSKNKINVRLYL